MTKILLLAANPKDSSTLQLSQEIREIDRELHHAKFGTQFKFEYKLAVRLRDLSDYLDEVKPDIVHFSGHGTTSSAIVLEDDSGNSRPVSKESVKSIFALLKGRVRCVVLSACYSEAQANALAEEIDCVVGVLGEIDDQSALDFNREFYRQLANGRDVATALKLGRTHVADNHDLVRLLAFKANPSKVIFTQSYQRLRYIMAALVALGVLVAIGQWGWSRWLLDEDGFLDKIIQPQTSTEVSTTHAINGASTVACILVLNLSGTPASGSKPSIPLDALKYYRYGGDQTDNGADNNGKPQLPINGQKILFSLMKSFEMTKRDEAEGVTVSISLLNGSTISGIVEGSKFDSRLWGTTLEGINFSSVFWNIFRVDFQEQGDCQ